MPDAKPLATRAYVDAIREGTGRPASYNDLTDLPSINGTPVRGDMELDLGLDETQVRSVAKEEAGALVDGLPRSARTGSYNDLGDLPSINGRVLKGDVTLDVGGGGGTDAQMKAVAEATVNEKVESLPRVVKTGSYTDLADRPTINGKVLSGDVKVGGDQLTRVQVEDIAQTTADTAVEALSRVAKTGSYADMTGKPTVNGMVLDGDVILPTGGVSREEAQRIATSAAEAAVRELPESAKTGNYASLKGLPTINGQELTGDVVLPTSTDVTQSVNDAITDLNADLHKVAKSGSYEDLANLPTVNGQPLKGNVTIAGDGMSDATVRSIATSVVNDAITDLNADLHKVAKSGSYEDLANLPTVNGQPLKGNVTVEAEVDPGDVESAVEGFIDAGNPGFVAAVSDVIASDSQRVITSGWRFRTYGNREGVFEGYDHEPPEGALLVSYSEGGWELSGVDVRLADSVYLEYPNASITQATYKVPGDENAISLVFEFKMESGDHIDHPGDDLWTFTDTLGFAAERDSVFLDGSLGLMNENKVRDIAKSYLDGSYGSLLSAAVHDVIVTTRSPTNHPLAKLLDKIGVDVDEFFASNIELEWNDLEGTRIDKLFALVVNLVTSLVDNLTRYRLCPPEELDTGYLKDRSMNSIELPGRYRMPPRVEGYARDMQITATGLGSRDLSLPEEERCLILVFDKNDKVYLDGVLAGEYKTEETADGGTVDTLELMFDELATSVTCTVTETRQYRRMDANTMEAYNCSTWYVSTLYV